MTSELEMRVAALEERVGRVETNASVARQLASAVDRDIAELTGKVDSLRQIVNGLGEQTALRFGRLEERMDRLEERMDRLEERMDRLETGVTELRAGQAQIVGLLNQLIERDAPGDQE